MQFFGLHYLEHNGIISPIFKLFIGLSLRSKSFDEGCKN